MKRTVTPLKFPLKVGENHLVLPGRPLGRHFGMQQGVPTLWVPVVDTGREWSMTIYVALTGEILQDPENSLDYLGTAMNNDQSFVVHAFCRE